MNVAFVALIVLWWALIVYAALGGADFGAGVWDLFAVSRLATRQRRLINHALGPVWEANHVWLIFLIVGLFNVFPVAFSALVIALFFPFTIVLIGIVLRGAAFVFRYYTANPRSRFARWWGRVFSISSVITPFFLGVSAAAVASGKLLQSDGTPSATFIVSWTSPFALTIGAMAVALCATVAAVYLVVEAHDVERDLVLAESYRKKAVAAGAVTAFLGLIGLLFAPAQSPVLWQGMWTRALPVVLVTMVIGLATALTLWYRLYRLARFCMIAEVAFLLGAWGLAQYPYVIPPQYTIYNAANDPFVISILLISIACGLVILLPSLYYLFAVFKLPYPVPGLRRRSEQAHSPLQRQESVQS